MSSSFLSTPSFVIDWKDILFAPAFDISTSPPYVWPKSAVRSFTTACVALFLIYNLSAGFSTKYDILAFCTVFPGGHLKSADFKPLCLPVTYQQTVFSPELKEISGSVFRDGLHS